MLVRCPDCTTKYEIAATLIPENGVKVRCPKCKAVFPVSKMAAASGQASEIPAPKLQPSEPAPIAGKIEPKSKPVAAGRDRSPVATVSKSTRIPKSAPKSTMAAESTPAPKSAPKSTMTSESIPVSPPAPGHAGTRKKILDPHVAKRLARAVIQEVLYARTREREQALKNGTALSSFGLQLADAFDVYRERVSDDLPGATATFREAVNDILGEGRRLL